MASIPPTGEDRNTPERESVSKNKKTKQKLRGKTLTIKGTASALHQKLTRNWMKFDNSKLSTTQDTTLRKQKKVEITEKKQQKKRI